MKNNTRLRTLISFVLAISLLALPLTAFAKKGDKNFKRGMDYEQKQQWDKAAQEFTLAVAADPSNMEYQLHFRRASFNASSTTMASHIRRRPPTARWRMSWKTHTS